MMIDMPSLTDRIDTAIAPRAAALREGLSSPVRNERMAVVVGRVLGLCFVLVFATGLYSHYLQEPASWMRFPTSPAWLYQVSQGIHVTLGTVLIPLLLAKLYVVYPRLFEWPPVTSPRNALERGSVGLLVSTAILQPVIGLVNTFQWYPWPFPFRETHWALAWVMIGALAIHIAVKLPIITRLWRAGGETT